MNLNIQILKKECSTREQVKMLLVPIHHTLNAEKEKISQHLESQSISLYIKPQIYQRILRIHSSLSVKSQLGKKEERIYNYPAK